MTELESEIKEAIQGKNSEKLDLAIEKLVYETNYFGYVDILNELLLVPFHHHHQAITKALQNIKSPNSVPYIKKVLESNYEFLEYSGSDSYSITKWFSWALAEIGTKEAIDLMKEYANSPDEGIRYEMNYRLNKLK